MPEHGENRKDCSDFDAMSTESLEKLLYLDSQLTGEEALGVDVILYILEVIDSRRKETPAPQVPSPDVDKAWDTFRKKYFPNLSKSNGQSFYEYDDEPSSKNISHSTYERTISPPHPKKKRLLHVAYAAAIIAALLCIMTATASALGYDLWGALAQWSEETFSFTSKQEIDTQNTDVKDFTERTVNNSYKNIQDALNDYGITEPLVPTWFPDGYSLAEVKVKEFSKTKLTFDACYKCDDKTIAICVKKYENIDDVDYSIWQKDGGEVSTLEMNGTTFYLMTNLDRKVAVCLCGLIEIGISGDVSLEEMVTMIQSIYKGED